MVTLRSRVPGVVDLILKKMRKGSVLVDYDLQIDTQVAQEQIQENFLNLQKHFFLEK